MPAAYVRSDEYCLSDNKIAYIGSKLGNFAHHLVAGNPDRSGRVFPVRPLEDPQIRTANAGTRHPHQDLAAANGGGWHSLYPKISRTVVNSC